MILSTEIIDNRVWFRIDNPDARYIPVLQNCYYQQDERGFYKTYPADYRYIEQVRRNFVQYGKEMLDQLGYFVPVRWEEGLEAFIRRVAGTGIEWWLTGSGACCVRGVPIMPHDVDIMIHSVDVPSIAELFQDVLIEPILCTNGWVVKDFGVLFPGCRIDIASDPADWVDEPEPVDFGPYAKAHLEKVIWQGHEVWVPPLELSIAVNRKRERWDRVKLLEEHKADRVDLVIGRSAGN